MARLATEAAAAPIALADVTDPDIAELGGKATSLVRLARAGQGPRSSSISQFVRKVRRKNQ